MKKLHASDTQRQSSTDEYPESVNATCNYKTTYEQREMARLARAYDAGRTVTVTQDFHILINPEQAD